MKSVSPFAIFLMACSTAVSDIPPPGHPSPPLSRRQVLLLNGAMGADAARRELHLPKDPTDLGGLCQRAVDDIRDGPGTLPLRDEARGCRAGAVMVFAEAGRPASLGASVFRWCEALQ